MDERDVNHWDLTNGWPGVDPYTPGNKVDLLYYSGHGFPNGIRLFDPSVIGDMDREEDQQGRPDNIGPQEARVIEGTGYEPERINWEIGSDYTGTYRTDSRWNDDVEWVFLAACNQLSGIDNSRRNYARTMLGDPHRVHAIWGYDSTSPDDAVDVDIVNDFFYFVSQGRSNRYSWLLANDMHRATNAAGLVHASVENEGLPPVSPVDPDSPVGSTPDIHYWYIPTWDYAQQPVFRLDDAVDAFKRSAWRLFGEGAAYASTPDVLVGAETTYRVVTPLPTLEKLPVLACGRMESGPAQAEVMRALGDNVRRETASDAAYDVYRGDAGVVRIWRTGTLELLTGIESDGSAGMDRIQAVSLAERYIEDHGGVPDGARATVVRAMARADMDLNDGDLSTETVAEYIVRFDRFYDGVEIDGISADGVTVVLSANGVSEYRRQWRAISGRRDGTGLTACITAEDALHVLVDEGERYMGLPSEVEVTDIDLVYYSMGPNRDQGAMFPAWRIRLDGSAAFYVNAVTGRPMNE